MWNKDMLTRLFCIQFLLYILVEISNVEEDIESSIKYAKRHLNVPLVSLIYQMLEDCTFNRVCIPSAEPCGGMKVKYILVYMNVRLLRLLS